MPHQQAVSKALWEYLDVFMKLFLENFIVFNYMDTHVLKPSTLRNVFFLFLGIIIKFLMFQEGNLLYPIFLKPLSIC
jgi:hypothetical protein